MKRITYEKFKDRAEAIVRARKIFIPHFTKNITLAFELYQKLFAETEREIFLNTVTGGRIEMTQFDQYRRPACGFCGKPLYLRPICGGGKKHPGNVYGWRTCWECLEPHCIYESYSIKTVNQWMIKLRRNHNA